MQWKIKISGTFFIALFFVLIALFFSVLVLNRGENYSGIFRSRNGIIELDTSNLEYNVLLTGEWKYYSNQLLTSSKNASEPFKFVDVPHTWNGTGYGTYCLRIEGLDPGTGYCFYIPDTSSAFRFYLNEELVAENGKVGTSPDEEELHWEPRMVHFKPEQSSIEIIMQISNFHSYPGGFIREIKLGLPDNILAEKANRLSIQMILLGGILIIGLYNFSLFLLNPENKAALFFTLLNFLIVVRIILTGEKIINTWIVNPDWYLLLKLQFIIGAMMLGFFVLFMNNLFKGLFHKIIVRVLLGIVFVIAVIPVFIPINLLFFVDIVFLIISTLFFLYLIFILFKAIRQNVQGSLFAFMGIAFILGTILLDLTLPPGSNVIPLGIFIFTIFESLVIAEKHSFVVEQNKILHQVASRDGMTNLYKKEHFIKLVSSIIDVEEPIIQHCLMFIDIDNFKNINDTYGHDAGDEVIIKVARNIVHSMRYSDIACRYGGDEFIVLLHNTKREEAEMIARRILSNFAEPIKDGENEISVGVSIGISFYPEDGTSMEVLSKTCDQRMYEAKKRGKNQYFSG